MTIATTAGQRFDRADGNQPYRPATAARDPRDIQIVSGWNVRDMTSPTTREHIDLLKLSITERGVDKPIAVKYDIKTGIRTLVDGQCRLQACRELWQEGKKIYVPIIEVKGDEAGLTAESLTSNAGLPLTQFEIGMGCRKLLDKYHWTKEQVAAHICKSVRYVTEAVMLAEAPAEAKALLADHKVTPGAVLHAIKEHGDAAVEVLNQAVAAHQPIPEPEPDPPQADLPDMPPRPARKPTPPKPLARPKAKSANEKLVKEVPKNVLTLLKLADKLAELVRDNDSTAKDCAAAARAYQAARKS